MLFQFQNIGLEHYLILSALLFCLGLLTVLTRRNILVLLMGIELLLNAVNLSFIAFSHFRQDIDGQLMVFFIMTIAAAEAGIALALAVNIFKYFKTTDISTLERLRG